MVLPSFMKNMVKRNKMEKRNTREHEKIIYQTEKTLVKKSLKITRIVFASFIFGFLFLFILSLFFDSEIRIFTAFLTFFVNPILIIFYFIIKSSITSYQCTITHDHIFFYQRVWGFPVEFKLPLSEIQSFFTTDYRLGKWYSFHFKMKSDKEYFIKGGRNLHPRTLLDDYSIYDISNAEVEKVKQVLFKKHIPFKIPQVQEIRKTFEETYKIPKNLITFEKYRNLIFVVIFILIIVLYRLRLLSLSFGQISVSALLSILFFYLGFIMAYYKVPLRRRRMISLPDEEYVIHNPKLSICMGIFLIVMGVLILGILISNYFLS